MTIVQAEATGLIVLTTAAFAIGRWRHEIIALLSLFAAAALGLVPEAQLFSGVANPAVITIVAVLLITHAIGTSGLVENIARLVGGRSRSPGGLVALLCGFAATLSAFMNDIGALALTMPVAAAAGRRKGLSAGSMLMPLSFATLLGGTCTLIGTPANLIVNQQRLAATGTPFGFFDLVPVGGPIAVLGIGWLATFGWRLLRPRPGVTGHSGFEPGRYVTEMQLGERSPLIGRSVPEVELALDLTVHGIIRHGRRVFARRADRVLRKRDVLILEARAERLGSLTNEQGLVFSSGAPRSRSGDTVVMEAVVTGTSLMLGSTLATLEPRERWDIDILGITRQYQRVEGRLTDVPIGPGDVLLVSGRRDRVMTILGDLGCLPLAERNVVADLRSAAPALALFIGAIGLAAASLTSPEVAFSLAVIGLMLLRRIDLRTAQRAVDGSVIIMLAAMIPVGQCLQTTGAADAIARGAMSLLGTAHPAMLVCATLATTVALTAFLNNATTAILLGPIAASVAHQAGAAPDPFLVAVMVGASADFLTPFGHHNNALVMGPGFYRFTDYPRVGLGLTALVLLVGPPLILLCFPL